MRCDAEIIVQVSRIDETRARMNGSEGHRRKRHVTSYYVITSLVSYLPTRSSPLALVQHPVHIPPLSLSLSLSTFSSLVEYQPLQSAGSSNLYISITSRVGSLSLFALAPLAEAKTTAHELSSTPTTCMFPSSALP